MPPVLAINYLWYWYTCTYSSVKMRIYLSVTKDRVQAQQYWHMLPIMCTNSHSVLPKWIRTYWSQLMSWWMRSWVDDLAEKTDKVIKVSMSPAVVSLDLLPICVAKWPTVCGIWRVIHGRGTKAHPYLIEFFYHRSQSIPKGSPQCRVDSVSDHPIRFSLYNSSHSGKTSSASGVGYLGRVHSSCSMDGSHGGGNSWVRYISVKVLGTDGLGWKSGSMGSSGMR